MYKATSVTDYIENHQKWTRELQLLVDLCEETELETTIKWGAPTFTIKGKNVVGIAAFKNHIALWFHQGVYLKDPDSQLINANEGQTKGLFQWRFNSYDDINTQLVRKYLQEAIENEKQGKRIAINRDKPITLPIELKNAIDANSDLASAFKTFTKSKQREFTEYIDSAKRDQTRLTRLNKCTKLILAGVGLNDKYRV